MSVALATLIGPAEAVAATPSSATPANAELLKIFMALLRLPANACVAPLFRGAFKN